MNVGNLAETAPICFTSGPFFFVALLYFFRSESCDRLSRPNAYKDHTSLPGERGPTRNIDNFYNYIINFNIDDYYNLIVHCTSLSGEPGPTKNEMMMLMMLMMMLMMVMILMMLMMILLMILMMLMMLMMIVSSQRIQGPK